MNRTCTLDSFASFSDVILDPFTQAMTGLTSNGLNSLENPQPTIATPAASSGILSGLSNALSGLTSGIVSGAASGLVNRVNQASGNVPVYVQQPAPGLLGNITTTEIVVVGGVGLLVLYLVMR